MVKQQISEQEITFILWHFVLKGNKNFTVGSQQKIRVGRVTVNTHIFFLRQTANSSQRLQTVLNEMGMQVSYSR